MVRAMDFTSRKWCRPADGAGQGRGQLFLRREGFGPGSRTLTKNYGMVHCAVLLELRRRRSCCKEDWRETERPALPPLQTLLSDGPRCPRSEGQRKYFSVDVWALVAEPPLQTPSFRRWAVVELPSCNDRCIPEFGETPAGWSCGSRKSW
jgi:hypothetical protein